MWDGNDTGWRALPPTTKATCCHMHGQASALAALRATKVALKLPCALPCTTKAALALSYAWLKPPWCYQGRVRAILCATKAARIMSYTTKTGLMWPMHDLRLPWLGNQQIYFLFFIKINKMCNTYFIQFLLNLTTYYC